MPLYLSLSEEFAMAIKAFSASATLAGCNDYAKRPAISLDFPITRPTKRSESSGGRSSIARQTSPGSHPEK
jgi:hypothetical protein